MNSEFADQLKEKSGCEIIITSSKEKLASSFQDDEGKRFFPLLPDLIDEKGRKMEIFKENYLIDNFPVFDYFEKHIGAVSIAVNVKNIVVAKSEQISNLIVAISIVLILVVFISLFIGRILTRPILLLSQSAESISRGNYDVQVDLNSKDEIGHLSEVFSKMATSIKSQREEILDL